MRELHSYTPGNDFWSDVPRLGNLDRLACCFSFERHVPGPRPLPWCPLRWQLGGIVRNPFFPATRAGFRCSISLEQQSDPVGRVYLGFLISFVLWFFFFFFFPPMVVHGIFQKQGPAVVPCAVGQDPMACVLRVQAFASGTPRPCQPQSFPLLMFWSG